MIIQLDVEGRRMGWDAQHADRRRPGVAELTAQAYRRIRCGECANQFNQPSADVLNRAQDPSERIATGLALALRQGLALQLIAGNAPGADSTSDRLEAMP